MSVPLYAAVWFSFDIKNEVIVHPLQSSFLYFDTMSVCFKLCLVPTTFDTGFETSITVVDGSLSTIALSVQTHSWTLTSTCELGDESLRTIC